MPTTLHQHQQSSLAFRGPPTPYSVGTHSRSDPMPPHSSGTPRGPAVAPNRIPDNSEGIGRQLEPVAALAYGTAEGCPILSPTPIHPPRATKGHNILAQQTELRPDQPLPVTEQAPEEHQPALSSSALTAPIFEEDAEEEEDAEDAEALSSRSTASTPGPPTPTSEVSTDSASTQPLSASNASRSPSPVANQPPPIPRPGFVFPARVESSPPPPPAAPPSGTVVFIPPSIML
ncbi:hypothetical protein B0T19DRAFT_413218 [Cercophora scortea]|uniref:Uncharacterized protein n=1 Tax=Cercophora scortea TaxID=314031 RepID=A0AAE0J6T7_9PEZI|nr:hypothetical protein B0T19DRAFT_413218 [Cercophora scortea]